MRCAGALQIAVAVLLVAPAAGAWSLAGRVVRADDRGADQGVAHVAVLLDGDRVGAEPAPAAARLDEAWVSFVPKVQVVRPGTTLLVRNGDDESHTLHGRLGGATLWDFASVPARGAPPRVERVRLDRLGVVEITCDIHDEMRAFIVVSDAAHSAVTDAEGGFRVDRLPPGRYRVRAFWDPREEALRGARVRLPVDEEPGVTLATVEVPLPSPLLLRLPPLPPRPAPSFAREPAPTAAAPTGTRDRLPAWLRRLPDDPWPSGRLAWVAAALALVLGVALGLGHLRLATRAGWEPSSALIVGGALCIGSGLLVAVGLHGAVAAALGLGLFVGSAIGVAVDSR